MLKISFVNHHFTLFFFIFDCMPKYYNSFNEIMIPLILHYTGIKTCWNLSRPLSKTPSFIYITHYYKLGSLRSFLIMKVTPERIPRAMYKINLNLKPCKWFNLSFKNLIQLGNYTCRKPYLAINHYKRIKRWE